MPQTPNLAFPLLAAGQAQKHVTHNEALMRLDSLVQLSVKDKDLTAPPASPPEGGRYIVAAQASGLWAGHAGQIALWQDQAWQFITPSEGWTAFVEDEAVLYLRKGAIWKALGDDLMANVALMGINAQAGASERFALKSDSALMSHDDVTPGTGDMRVKLNKSMAARTASFLFQNAYQGRAEIGLAGDDNLRIKVSSNGTSWKDALVVRAGDGEPVVASLSVQGAAGGQRSLKFTTAGTLRWELGCSSSSEAGAASGSNFFLNAYDDNGAYLGTPMSVTRSAMKVSFPWVEFSALGPVFFKDILPSTDNIMALGSPTKRWSTVYAAAGVVTTSDARLKRDIMPNPLGLDFICQLSPRLYRWQDRQGDSRLQSGLIAQEVKAALETAGLDCGIWEDGLSDAPQGLRYEQLIAPLVGAIQEMSARLEALEAGR